MGTLISHYSYTLLSTGAATASKLEEDRIFALDGQMLFDAAVLALNIFLLFVLLSYILFNPVRKVLEERQNKITKEREAAELDRVQSEQLKLDYQNKIEGINNEAEIILSDARKKAIKNEQKIENEAKQEAARIIAHAKLEAELEKKKAADEIKKEIILVSTLMANKLVAVSVDKQTQDSLIEDTLREIGDKTWQS